ncbi:MAG: hypothetical protein A3B34_01690 [Candidatus Sungbacteria bacterium RIFCSPLOWO2_01_FULL_54_21]|uniref:Uncharacterized protein n=2 Tax=Candidatus Sungiibacteriota TaxID=1817917 RepID=A0A1G2L9A8_9BACT|nr:MAG: hypothetical protein A2679_00910 [Candidatus Sungbacteria bacterium RIFCSPHIGHO2_01_FULL_54_26]OHA03196.1 MAG: hypothetical protein A3C92_01630 [Candidatus Sungbacteria bacterium RIFCSPHIGHO2_02_FULL_53_17]OHA08120.1 MAG: hypothetical protein A3B34_01690 [Candidatus Sungbacteria bacterium RIFCSPLOWO2_01_FULL_54_21]
MPRAGSWFFFPMAKNIYYSVFSLLAALLMGGAGAAYGASIFDIEYPIADLGGCGDRAACRTYCDDAAHGDACLVFAQKFGLADQKSAAKAKAVQEEGGPGGCRGGDACHAYCEDSAHQDECVDYAVQKGFMSPEDAARAKKPGPGGCLGRACEEYCHNPANKDACFEFAVANGLIPKDEAALIREFKEKFGRENAGPGGCQGEDACRQYCEDPAHITECVSFAEEHGFVGKEQAKIIKKTAGRGPGGCKGTAECRAYCDDSAHQQECIDFGEKNGFMTPEEAARARKFAGKEGPGGCRGEQCRDFCNAPGNEASCFEFAEREGLIPKEELARARKFTQASREGGPGGCRGVQCRTYCEDAAHREECFSFAREKGLISKEEEQHFEAGSKIGEVVRTSGGPGGCKSDDECRAYCTDPSHVEECVAFGATHGGVPLAQAREMLKQFSERRFEVRGGSGEFGSDGFEDFQKFERDAGRRFEEFRALEEQFRGKNFLGGQEGSVHREGSQPFGGSGEGGGTSFAGPGGCASPAECIKYCTDHRDECFGGGPSDRKEQDGQRGFQGEFPGRPDKFPGRPDAFPPEGERGQFPFSPDRDPGATDHENPGAFPPPGGFPRPDGGSFRPPQGMGEFPPEGLLHPPAGSFMPPPDAAFHRPEGSFTPPPSGSFDSSQPPPPPPDGGTLPPPSLPSSAAPFFKLFGTLLGIF